MVICMVIVIVVDMVVFEVFCQVVIVQFNVNGQGVFSVVNLDGGSSDVCGFDILYIS